MTDQDTTRPYETVYHDLRDAYVNDVLAAGRGQKYDSRYFFEAAGQFAKYQEWDMAVDALREAYRAAGVEVPAPILLALETWSFNA